MDLDRELQVGISAAVAAGAALRRHQDTGVAVQYKGGGEAVTIADIEADSIIRAALAAAFPNDAIFSEETADSLSRLANHRVWIVDPLDSTGNFLEKGDEYSVSIGLAVDGHALLGVVYNPARDELFAGCDGDGVILNGARAETTRATSIQGARITVSRKEWRGNLPSVCAGWQVTPLASMAYKLARVAAGLDDATFSLKCRKEWGTCGGVALLRAAGGRASLLNGSEVRFNRSSPRQPCGMIAAGLFLHPVLLGRLGALKAGHEEADTR